MNGRVNHGTCINVHGYHVHLIRISVIAIHWAATSTRHCELKTTTADKHLSVALSPLLLICDSHSNRDFYRSMNYKFNINIGTAFVVLNLSSREIRDSK